MLKAATVFRMKKKFKTNSKLQELPFYQRCQFFLKQEISQFVEAMLQGEDKAKQTQLADLINNKAKSLLRSLLTSNKLKWLGLLMIKNPNTEQLVHVEKLQRITRNLRMRPKINVENQAVATYCAAILKTPEFVTQAGKLIV